MSFKYYDTLSTLISGCLLLLILSEVLNKDLSNISAILLLALAYVLGYILNAVSGWLEPFYFWTMGGIPSDKLLSPASKGKTKDYTGYGRIRFYQYQKAINLLKAELEDTEASTRKMFERAMTYSNSNSAARVPDFNALFAFSRVMLTLAWVVGIILAFEYYCCWWYWLILATVIFVLWNRCKEMGYYYAKEVLVEYLKIKEKESENT